MSPDTFSDQFQLTALKEALKAKENDIRKQTSKGKGKNVTYDVVGIALQLVNKMDLHLSQEAENRMAAPLLTFEDDKDLVKDAFLLLLDQLFADSSKVRSACQTFFGLVGRPPNSIDFLSNELTSKLTKDGVYTNWMTNEIRKGNGSALKTWNVLIRMMGKSIHQPGPGVQVINTDVNT